MVFSLSSGLLTILAVYPSVALLYSVLPARTVTGYACDCISGKPLKYRLNGVLTLATVIASWFILGLSNLVPFEFVAENFYSSLFFANAIGLLGSFALYVQGESLPVEKVQAYPRCPTRDRPGVIIPTNDAIKEFRNKPLLSKMFLGLEFNPRFQEFDVKMFLYLVGAVMLELNVLSAAFLQRKTDGQFSNATLLYTFLFTHFVVEYLFFEEVHLYTYDLFAEKVGFKLFWGCCVFYPFFYAVGTRSLVFNDLSNGVAKGTHSDMSFLSCSIVATLFYSGWLLTRGSNLQKFYFKTNPNNKTVFRGLISQESISGTHILYSGFWGVSRHINYFGETIQALALAIPGWWVSGSLIPFLYPLYYVGLFTTRQIDDDKVCQLKYGAKWDEYVKRVPYRIIPYVW